MNRSLVISKHEPSDRGAYAVLYAVIILVMIGVAGLVVDMGSLRLDRRQNRSASDAAAVAGADKLGPSGLNPGGACAAAMRFAESSLNMTASVVDNCSAKFTGITANGYCTTPPSRPIIQASEVLGTGNNRRYVIFAWPVYDSSEFMTLPDRELRGPHVQQSISLQDGTACKRVGVSIKQQRTTPFGAAIRVAGAQSTESRSVALATFSSGGGSAPAPLVVLDPKACDVLLATGSPGDSGGGIIVTGSTSKPDGTRDPGMIQVDSDGSATSPTDSRWGNNCNAPDRGTIRQNGSKKRIWVLDGSPGIEGSIGSYAALINPTHVYVGDTVGCPDPGTAWPATELSSVPPEPNLCRKPTPGTPVGDAPWVNRYNCNLSTMSCPPPGPGKPPLPPPRNYVDQWIAYATGTQPPAFAERRIYSGPPSPQCTIGAGTPPVVGDFFTDCPELKIEGNFRVGGKFVALHDVKITSGCLLLNQSDTLFCGSPMPYADPSVAPADGNSAYIGGKFTIDPGGALVQNQVFMFVGGEQSVNTSRQVTIVSPYGTKLGPSVVAECEPASSSVPAPSATCFEDLAMWTNYAGDKTTANKYTGSAALRVDGTLFMGKAAMTYNGSGDSHQARAQFVTRSLTLTGGGTLFMTPDSTRSTEIPRGSAALIR